MSDWLQQWREQNRFDPAYLPALNDKLYFEGDQRLRKLTNYVVLLALATIIATYGVTSASTATVIGAMLVAPLMTPIMAATLALVTAQEGRFLRSLALVIISVAGVIALAALLSLFVPYIDFDANGEIVSRVNPGLSAMAVALAAGAAGAFATSRSEVGDSLPGVAIAISLVPPLSVVGIGLSHGRLSDAFGAFLLFFTNFLAIILSGSLVFWFSGANALQLTEAQMNVRRRGYIITIVSALIVLFLLGTTTYRAYQHNRRVVTTQTAVTDWLEGTDYEPVRLDMRYPWLTLTIVGSGDLAPVEELAQTINSSLDEELFIILKKVAQEKEAHPEDHPTRP